VNVIFITTHGHMKVIFLSCFSDTSIFFRHIVKVFSNIQFHNNPSSGSQVVLYGPTDGHTGMTKLTVAYRSFCEHAQTLLLKTPALLRTLDSKIAVHFWRDADDFISSIKQCKESLLPSSKTLDPKDTRPTVRQNFGNSLPLHVT
jgi:hypothetical protein